MNHWVSVKQGYLFRAARPSFGELSRSFLGAAPALGLPLIIMTGILCGIFTPTEAAAAAVAYSLVLGLVVTRSLNWSKLMDVFAQSGTTSAAVLLIVSMASIFSWLLTLLQVPQSIASNISAITNRPAVVMLLVALVVFLCGMVIDTLPALIILVPVLGPLVDKFHLDPLYFAVTVVLNLIIGLVTPPVGPVLFVISTVGNIRYERLVKAALPLILAEVVVMVLVIAFPPIRTPCRGSLDSPTERWTLDQGVGIPKKEGRKMEEKGVFLRSLAGMLVLTLALAGTSWAAPKVMKYGHFQPAKLDQPKHAAALAFKN